MSYEIGIDIRMLARASMTGIEEYVSKLLENMLELDKDIEYKLFYNGFVKSKLDYDWLRLPNVELKEFKIPNRFLDASLRLGSRPKIDKLIGGVDKFFSPHIFLSATGPNCEKITTFHDLSFEKYTRFYSFQKNFWHLSMDPRKQAESADKIIAVSQSTKQDLVKIYKINPEKIRVIYSGLSRQAKHVCLPQEKNYVKNKYHLPENYILYLGTLEPRKNIVSLLKAFEKTKTGGMLKNSNFKLVIAGAKGWLYEDIFHATQNSSCKNDIFFTGFVEEKDKAALYEMASLFVYPSFYEGFGFPPLEAMAQHTPVITSNISSIPEAVDNSAILINPTKPDEIKRAIEMVLTDKKLSEKLSLLGDKRIQKFDWKKCAEETLSFIME